MVDAETSITHHFLVTEVAHRIAQVPPNAQENQFWFELSPFERIVDGHVVDRLRIGSDGDPSTARNLEVATEPSYIPVIHFVALPDPDRAGKKGESRRGQ